MTAGVGTFEDRIAVSFETFRKAACGVEGRDGLGGSVGRGPDDHAVEDRS